MDNKNEFDQLTDKRYLEPTTEDLGHSDEIKDIIVARKGRIAQSSWHTENITGTDQDVNDRDAEAFEIIPNVSELKVGETVRLFAFAKKSDGNLTPNDPNVVWESDNWDVAFFTDNGVLHAKKVGEVVIKATDVENYDVLPVERNISVVPYSDKEEGSDEPGGNDNPGSNDNPNPGDNQGGAEPGGNTDPNPGENPGGGDEPGGNTDPDPGENPGGNDNPDPGENPGGESSQGTDPNSGGSNEPGENTEPGGDDGPNSGGDEPGGNDDPNSGGNDDPNPDPSSGENEDPGAGSGNGDDSGSPGIAKMF